MAIVSDDGFGCSRNILKALPLAPVLDNDHQGRSFCLFALYAGEIQFPHDFYVGLPRHFVCDAESAMARKNPTPDILFDNAVLKMSRRKGGIDYLHWLDDIDSLRAKVPRSTRRGYWARLDDVRPADLMSLPDEVLARPVTLAEISVDFIPKGVTSVQEQAQILTDTYRVLFKRLERVMHFPRHPRTSRPWAA